MSKHHYIFMNKGFDFVKAVARLLGSDFEKKQMDDGVEFKHKSGNRILKLIDDPDTLIVAFDVPIPNLYKDAPVEVVHHHGDHHKHEWIFKGNKIEDVYTLIEIALENYDPHKVH